MALHVLVVDDDPSIAKLVGKMLTARGARVTVATSGREALDSVEREQPNLILLDIMMPGMDGSSVLAEIRRRPALNATRIVMLTARNLPKDALEAHRVGADGYVTKPFTMDELLKAVGLA